MDPDEAVVARFFAAFGRGDAEGMAACYADDARFSDPVFTDLRGEEVRDMWRMLLSRAGPDFRVACTALEASGGTARARWEAWYSFGRRRRPVHNVVASRFTLAGGRIVRQEDSFDLPRWLGMALGPLGKAFGRTRLLQERVRRGARQNLERFQRRRADGSRRA